MHDQLLPLFPLNVVLLPQNPLPLHIFEERYKEMIGEAIESGSEFGIVLSAEGGIVNAGCSAAVEQVLQTYPDGRMDIMTFGRRRFIVQAIDQVKSYLRGEVEFFEDEEDYASVDLRTGALRAFQSAGHGMSEEEERSGPLLSFDLARDVRDLHFRQRLLMCRSEPERLRLLIDFFPAQSLRDRYAERMKVLAPTNGHGHKGPGVSQ